MVHACSWHGWHSWQLAEPFLSAIRPRPAACAQALTTLYPVLPCSALLLTVGPNCGGIAASNPGLARYITGAIGLPFQVSVPAWRRLGWAGR